MRMLPLNIQHDSHMRWERVRADAPCQVRLWPQATTESASLGQVPEGVAQGADVKGSPVLQP